jgi:hypothetical protein
MRRSGTVSKIGRRGEGDEADRQAHMAVTWEREGVFAGMRKVEENTPFDKYIKAAWTEWAEQGSGGLRGKAGQRRQGWAEIWGRFFFE